MGSSAAPTRAGSEEVAKDVTEDILETRGKIKPRTERTATVKGRMAKPIVLGLFFRVCEDLVGLRNFLELLLRLLVSRIPVGMVL